MSDLHIPSSLFQEIRAEGQRAYPNECCGIMFGRDLTGPQPRRVVDRLEPADNAFDAAERFHRFTITPKRLMQAERTAAAEGRLVVGFYHSHPDHPARPSDTDAAHAWPFYSYIIVAIEKGRAAAMTSWLFDETKAAFAVQSIITDAAASTKAPQEVKP